jgi:hypothetical protein
MRPYQGVKRGNEIWWKCARCGHVLYKTTNPEPPKKK